MKTITSLLLLFCTSILHAQTVEGKWKCIASYSSFDNKQTNMEDALHQSRPCTKNTIYEFQADGKIKRIYSGCDEIYVATQDKLWKKQQWKLEGENIKTSVTNFMVFKKYTLTFSGNKMTWTNKEETIIYEKL